jgi:hypothetical protein
VRLPLSTRTLTCCANLLRAHLNKIGSRWRKLPAGRIAQLVLALLRHDQRLADLAGGNDVSATTLARWRDEMLDLPAARAPRIDRALKKIAASGGEVVLLDGTLVRTRRRTGRENRRNYSGKHKCHGLLFLALTDERGNLIWISPARKGSASEITCARRDKPTAYLRTADLGALADLGFIGTWSLNKGNGRYCYQVNTGNNYGYITYNYKNQWHINEWFDETNYVWSGSAPYTALVYSITITGWN